MGELGFCHYSDIFAAIKLQLISDITTDGGWPFFLIRALHNKFISGIIFSLQCYLGYFDTQQVFAFISPFLLPFIVYALWGKMWRKGIIILTLIFPVIFIFILKPLNLGIKIYIFQGFWILIAVLGWMKLITKLFDKN